MGRRRPTEMRYYNGFSEQEIAASDGLLKLGIEQVKPLVTRGHLVDVAGLKGRMLTAGEEIMLADVRQARRGRACERTTSARATRSRPHRLGPALD